MKQLSSVLTELEMQIANKEKINIAISTSTVGWQINHCLIVINGVINQLQQSDPEKFVAKFNFKRWLIFTTNHIPRGKANAPKHTNPQDEATTLELNEKIALAKKNCALLPTLQKNQFFKHPFFGDLNLKQTTKFLNVHTFHHLKIIRDLVKNEL